MHIPFDNSYARLPERFYARTTPTTAQAPALIALNADLAAELGLDPEWLRGPAGVAFLSGKDLAEGSEPIATAYAGHQFGHFVPQLGDGRAILLGEVNDREGRRRDIQLKGAGRTPFSRGADGKAALGPVLREYVVSEAMAALGIPTTRALAAATTGETVQRDRPLPGAVLARVASSHIRVGTFQFFAARGDVEAVRLLADHAIARHYRQAAGAERPYVALLRAVVEAQARLIAGWLSVGFIHGVMNTDNMSIAGETIDYGPCAFLDVYDPATVFSSIDERGRYAYGNQPQIGLWNLSRFAETLLPLLHEDEAAAIAEAEAVLGEFAPLFQQAHAKAFRRKIGLAGEEPDDPALIKELLGAMATGKADFTLTFRLLADAQDDAGERAGEPADELAARALFAEPRAFDAWVARWRARLARDPQEPAARRTAMRAVNPAVIPRNHRVEAMIAAAVDGDFAPFEELLAVLARPFDELPGMARYHEPPAPGERVFETFCGT